MLGLGLFSVVLLVERRGQCGGVFFCGRRGAGLVTGRSQIWFSFLGRCRSIETWLVAVGLSEIGDGVSRDGLHGDGER